MPRGIYKRKRIKKPKVAPQVKDKAPDVSILQEKKPYQDFNQTRIEQFSRLITAVGQAMDVQTRMLHGLAAVLDSYR